MLNLYNVLSYTGRDLLITMASRSAFRFVSRRFSNGKVLSEEEKAAENVFIKVYFSLYVSDFDSSKAIKGIYFPFVVVDDDENVP